MSDVSNVTVRHVDLGEAAVGLRIDWAVEEAKRIIHNFDVDRAAFIFNGSTITVFGDSDVNDVCAEYNRGRMERQGS